MTKNYLARIPERSKGMVLRAIAYASWVRIPLRAYYKIVRKDIKIFTKQQNLTKNQTFNLYI